MQSIEVTGKSVEEATQAASTKLGVPSEQIKITVLEETKGLFGKTQVRVQAEVEGNSKAKPSPTAVTKAVVEEKAPPKKATKKKVETEVKEEEPAAAEKPSKEAEVENIATEEDGEILIALIDSLMAKGELEVEVKVKEISGKYVTVSLDGKDVSHLMGRQGEVLNALQSLINIMIGRKLNRGFRATLDSGDFRSKREAILESLAEKLATEVVKRQEEAVLDALPAFERRVVHRLLQQMPGVTTYSEGEEPNRHVVIAPKGGSSSDD